MSTFKCKMCGGEIEFEQGATVGVCDSCGTKQTLPRLDDDRKANLYDRANHFRRNNDFDKAMGIYEQILNEDGTDAETYWSLVLCRYGIEYVEDPATHKRVPTVNRAQYTSIFDDDDYKSALKYADGYQRSIYAEEAKAINKIHKGIRQQRQKNTGFCAGKRPLPSAHSGRLQGVFQWNNAGGQARHSVRALHIRGAQLGEGHGRYRNKARVFQRCMGQKRMEPLSRAR